MVISGSTIRMQFSEMADRREVASISVLLSLQEETRPQELNSNRFPAHPCLPTNLSLSSRIPLAI